MHRAYVNFNLLSNAKEAEDYPLNPELLKRFKQILRLKNGEKIELFDGSGRLVQGILNNENFLTQVKILYQNLQGPSIKLYQALVSMTKLETITQHATELGVSEIILFRSNRSQIDFKDKTDSKIERLSKIATDASRQCGRADIPVITYQKTLKPDATDLVLLASPTASQSLKNLTQKLGKSLVISILVGPEGGFTETEIQLSSTYNAHLIRLAPQILRTETASLAMLAQIQGIIL